MISSLFFNIVHLTVGPIYRGMIRSTAHHSYATVRNRHFYDFLFTRTISSMQIIQYYLVFLLSFFGPKHTPPAFSAIILPGTPRSAQPLCGATEYIGRAGMKLVLNTQRRGSLGTV